MKMAGVFSTGLFVVFVMIAWSPVWSSTGGVTNVGGFSFSAEHFTGVREWIELENAGGLLKGAPPHDVLKLITVRAPGMERGHLIFRELETFDGRQSFLLTAPDKFADSIKRITLFLQPKSGGLELYEDVEGRWMKRLSQPIRVSQPNGYQGSPNDLLAFSVKKPGFFWVKTTSTSSLLNNVPFIPQESTAKSLMGGSLLLGFSILVTSIGLLCMAWFFSQKIHSLDRLVSK